MTGHRSMHYAAEHALARQEIAARWQTGAVTAGGGLSSIGRLINSEIVDPLTRSQLRDQPARLLATTGPSL